MKRILIASGLLNLGFVIVLHFRPELAPSKVRESVAELGIQGMARSLPSSSPTNPRIERPTAPLWSTVGSDDLHVLVARLRKAGFPSYVVRQIVNSLIDAQYRPKYRALEHPDPAAPFWKLSSPSTGDGRYEQFRLLERERSKLLRELFSDELFASDEATQEQNQRFGNLPRAKADMVQRIEDDYAELTAAVRTEMKGITLPEDRDKFFLLDHEKRVDLAGVLTESEYAEFEIRSSPITANLRGSLSYFDPTFAEFSAIFTAQKALAGKFLGGPSSDDPSITKAADDYFEALHTSLGDQRFQDYIRTTDPEFLQVTALAEKEGLPADVAAHAYSLRESASSESNRIFDDAMLGSDEKRALLQSLAENTRTQMAEILGPKVDLSYLTFASAWLDNIAKGAAVSFENKTISIAQENGESFSRVVGNNYRFLPTTAAGKH